jgi:hypothetical protein
MVKVYVQKNDGVEKPMAITVNTNDGDWDMIKMQCARTLYTEEELFSIQGATSRDLSCLMSDLTSQVSAGPHEIKMFRCPQGHNEEARKGKHGAAAMLTPESVWSVEIFGANFRSGEDLASELNRDLSMAQRGAAMGMMGSMSTSASDCFLNEDLHIHVTTFLPSLQNPQKWGQGGTEAPQSEDYESCLIAMVRCRRWLQSFHKKGHKLTVLSLQSVLLPGTHAGPAAVVRRGPQALYKGVYSPDGETKTGGAGSSSAAAAAAGGAGAAAASGPALPPLSMVQGVRVWFCFNQEKTIHVRKRGGHLGLQPVRQEEGWIMVRAIEGSPCEEAGMPLTTVYLTHMNGQDVSPHSFPSLAPKSPDKVTWDGAVLPLISQTDSFTITFFP